VLYTPATSYNSTFKPNNKKRLPPVDGFKKIKALNQAP
jgi:hypothetical protein